ncbi:SPRY domain-containing SOCS box protein 4 [Homalodisca vitripennis]|nr:SPRY domain-containing SOCS box protein 4 [Homalodisca vitripennis]
MKMKSLMSIIAGQFWMRSFVFLNHYCPPTSDFHEQRLPRKEAPCLTEGLYVWEVDWPSETRGSHAVVGVAKKGCLMYPVKRKKTMLNKVTTKLMVDGLVLYGSGDRCYPLQQDSSLYVVPDKFHVVLDMSNGTLSFIVEGKWLGTALSGMAGHCLYPIVTSRQGNCRIWRYLRW